MDHAASEKPVQRPETRSTSQKELASKPPLENHDSTSEEELTEGECHALEWPAAIERASRVEVLVGRANDLGHIYGKFGRAVLVARRAVDVADAEGSPYAQALARLEYGAALSAMAGGTNASQHQALRVLEDAHKRMRSIVGAEHPSVVSVLLALAFANQEKKANATALNFYREALKLARRIDADNPGHYPLEVSIKDRLSSFCENGHKPACTLLWREFPCFGPDGPDAPACVAKHAEAASSQDGGVTQAPGDPKPEPEPKKVGRRWTLALEALELVEEGNLNDAETFARIAVELSEGHPEALSEVEARIVLAHILSAQGDHEKAMSALDKALQRAERTARLQKPATPQQRAHLLLHIAATGDQTVSDTQKAIEKASSLCRVSGEDAAQKLLKRFCEEGCPAACKLVRVSSMNAE